MKKILMAAAMLWGCVYAQAGREIITPTLNVTNQLKLNGSSITAISGDTSANRYSNKVPTEKLTKDLIDSARVRAVREAQTNINFRNGFIVTNDTVDVDPAYGGGGGGSTRFGIEDNTSTVGRQVDMQNHNLYINNMSDIGLTVGDYSGYFSDVTGYNSGGTNPYMSLSAGYNFNISGSVTAGLNSATLVGGDATDQANSLSVRRDSVYFDKRVGGSVVGKLMLPNITGRDTIATKADVRAGVGGGTLTNPITFTDSGTGAASGTTADGSSAVTVSYNTIGAAPATSGTSILKGNSSGGFSNATAGTDYLSPTGSGTGLTGIVKVSDSSLITGQSTNYARIKSRDSLQTNIDANTTSLASKAPLASPTFTGTPAAPTPSAADSTTKLATTQFVAQNALPLRTSGIMPTRKGYFVYPQTTTNYESPIEILNIGSNNNPSDSSHYVLTGLAKNNWSFLQTWNMKYDSSNLKWTSPILSKPSFCTEVGLEGFTIHAVPAGTNFSDTWHEQFQVRPAGVDGTTGLTSGVFIQAKTGYYAKYKSGTYGGDTDPWTGGGNTKYIPFAWYHTEESKGGAAIWIMSNHTTGVTGMPISFYKSNGTYASPSAASANSNALFIRSYIHDGLKFQGTADIIAYSEKLATSGNAPQKMVIRTSSTDSSALKNSLEVSAAGLTSLYSGSAVASAATITPTGNLFHVTGTTTITSVAGSINSVNIVAGTTITIIFDGALTFTDGSNLKLAGDFVTTADDTITLVYDGSNWYEKSRSVN